MNRVAAFFIILFALNQINLSSTVAATCPGGLFSKEGSSPFIFLVSPDTKKEIVCCGYFEDTNEIEKVEASEFEVISTWDSKTLLTFGASDFCNVEVKNDKLLITELKRLPFGPDRSWVNIDYIRYELRFDAENDLERKEQFVFKPPILSADEIKKIVSEYHTMEKDRKADYKLIAYIFAAALNGDNESKGLLMAMRKDFDLDGSVGEFYTDVIEIYKKVQSINN